MLNPIPADAEYYLDEYDAERFWGHVNRQGGMPYADDPLATAVGQCWLWSSNTQTKEYGRFRVHSSWYQAHRISYMDFGNKLTDEYSLDHLCRIPQCVNPAHLEPVTHAENVQRGKRGNITACAHGHLFTPENTRIVTEGSVVHRICRACRKRYARDSYLRRKTTE